MSISLPAARRPAGWLIALAGAAALLSALGLATPPRVAQAHDHRHVGPYEFTVGFMVEPAYEGIPNGVDLRILEGDDPVEGAEATLEVEVTHAESGVSRTFALRALWRQPGNYTADFVPTAPGTYIFTFTGAVGDLEVNETFEGGEGRFSDVESIATIQFPETVASAREIQGAASGARDIALDAEDAASTARTLALAGIGVGVLGVVIGGAGMLLALRGRAG